MKTAESAAVVETLAPGEPWRDLLDESTSLIAAEHAAADAVVFPREERPVTADTLNQYVAHTGRWPATGYDGHALELHGRCVRTHPELAACLRSVDCLEDIAMAASRQAAPADHLETHAAAGARAAAVAVARYKIDVARQVAGVDCHELRDAARVLLACEALRERLAVAKARHEAHAAAELARIETERRAVARAVVDRTVERVRAAADVAEDARRKALQSTEEYRQIKAAALVERLRLSGLRELRVGADRALFAVDDLVQTAAGCSLEQLDLYSAALAQHEAR